MTFLGSAEIPDTDKIGAGLVPAADAGRWDDKSKPEPAALLPP